MCMKDEQEPPRYRHDVRDDIDELARLHDLEVEEGDGGKVLMGEEVLVEVRDARIDFNDGRVFAALRVETPCFQVEMLAREVHSFGIGFEVVSHHDPSEGLRVHCMEGYR